jgi:hypothetical protein
MYYLTKQQNVITRFIVKKAVGQNVITFTIILNQCIPLQFALF